MHVSFSFLTSGSWLVADLLVCLRLHTVLSWPLCRMQSPCRCSSRRTRRQEHSTGTTTLHPDSMRGPSSVLTTAVSPEVTASAMQPRVTADPQAVAQDRRRSPRAAREGMPGARGARGATRRCTLYIVLPGAIHRVVGGVPLGLHAHHRVLHLLLRAHRLLRAGLTSNYLTSPKLSTISRTASAWAGDTPPGTQSIEPAERTPSHCACRRC
jgi:hypothetical protein